MTRLIQLLGGMVLCLVMFGPTAIAATKKKAHHSSTTTTATAHKAAVRPKTAGAKAVAAKAPALKTATGGKTVVRGRGARPRLAVRRTRYVERFTANSFSDNLTLGDVTEGEDPVVRAAAIRALGNMNGTAIAIDPTTGRILAMVNQKLALSRGAEPDPAVAQLASAAEQPFRF